MIVTDEYTEENRPEVAVEAPAEADTITTEDPAASDGAIDAASPQYGVGPFSIREVSLGGAWLIAFIASFFPVYGEIGNGPTVWGSGIDWLLTIGVPTVAVFLIVLRRLSPQGIRRVGSLGIDQFASVAFSVSTVLWLAIIWKSFITLLGQSVFAGTWVVWVEFIMMLAGVFLTVLAPFIPPLNQDFIGRTEVPAHRVARPARPVAPRPVQSAPAPAAEAAATPVYAEYAAPAEPGGDAAVEPAATDASPYWDADGDVVGADTATDATTVIPVADAQADADAATTVLPVAVADAADAVGEHEPDSQPAPEPQPEPVAVAEPVAASQHQAFWALVPEERDIVDEIGIPVFRIGPTAWALVIEDRGEVFVVRHEDGRIGYLHDVSGVTRG
ncbi:hypothetical protein [Microbacterium sp. NPDC058389]|uniref:hypothetical protein n=1 Tax=Microbacterium sp. NPDC058389 TaxID=3346475 RepID=UPI00365DD64E